MRASDLLVECLEAEGVEWVFGIPGEETVDLNASLDRSGIEFVPVRHEQGGAFIADVYGRLTGRPGVCLGTLGPGATNLVTGVADAFLDRAPMVVLTGQADLERLHKESHQHLDVMAMLAPVTKWNTRIADPAIIPEAVRKAFKVAATEPPGPCHLELPEDVMAAEVDGTPLPRTPAPRPEASSDEVERAARLICEADNPIVLAGNGAARAGASAAVRDFAHRTGVPVAETFMGKGLLDDLEDQHALGAVGLQAGDYELAGFGDADVVVAVGYDLVEHAPSHWNPDRDKTIVSVASTPAEIDQHFVPAIELVGNVSRSLQRLADACGSVTDPGGSRRLRDVVLARFERAGRDPATPMQPPRVLYELRRALRPQDVLVSDVGLHKLWIGRLFPAQEPNTVLIANGLAGMGFALPAAIASRLAQPDRRVVAVTGDGGFLMNVQELETAVRLGTALVTVVWEDGSYGSIVWKQRQRFEGSFGTDFGNPDFVALAESFGLPAWRCETADDLADRLHHALELDVPSLIVLPIDYSVDVAITSELGDETVAT